MTFERSPAGQANRAIFLNVDKIVYVEGGDEITGNVRSYDALFWRAAFKGVAGEIRCRFIPKGRKGVLKELALELLTTQPENCIIAMDRDYDEELSSLIDDPRVIYTLGYSFENDLYDAANLVDLFECTYPADCDRAAVEAEINTQVRAFTRAVRWPHLSDLYAVNEGLKGLDRDRPQRYLQSNVYGAEPVVSRDRMRAEVGRIGTSLSRTRRGLKWASSFNYQKCIGHLWEAFVFQLVCYMHAIAPGGCKLKYEQLRMVASTYFTQRLLVASHIDPVGSYYRSRIQTALAA